MMIEKITLGRRIHTNLDSHPFGSFYFFWSLHLFLSGLDLTDIHRLGLFLIIVDIPARNRRSSPRLGRRSFFHHHLFMRLPYFSLYGSTWIFSFSSLSVLAPHTTRRRIQDWTANSDIVIYVDVLVRWRPQSRSSEIALATREHLSIFTHVYLSSLLSYNTSLCRPRHRDLA